MKTAANINLILLLVYLNAITHNAHSFNLYDRKSFDKNGMEPYLIDDTSSSIDEHDSEEERLPRQIQPFLNKRRLDSAEKYFDWASKTNRPMEYLRGKRFWLFTKKDEHVNDIIPSVRASPGSLSQGIWRAGIVGRRRR